MTASPFWTAITNVGDTAVMLPCFLVIGAWLRLRGASSACSAWIGFGGAAMLVVAASKIAFMGWGIGIPAIAFTGISGHSMLSAAVLTVAGYLVTEGRGPALRFSGPLAGLALAGVVAGSRLLLHYHSLSEAVAGSLFGGAVALVSIGHARRFEPPSARQSAIFGLVLAVTIAGLHGQRFPSQRLIERVALALSGRTSPYTRADQTLPGNWPTATVHPESAPPAA